MANAIKSLKFLGIDKVHLILKGSKAYSGRPLTVHSADWMQRKMNRTSINGGDISIQ